MDKHMTRGCVFIPGFRIICFCLKMKNKLLHISEGRTLKVQVRRTRNVWLRFLVAKKHRSWRVFFTRFQYIFVFLAQMEQVPVFGLYPKNTFDGGAVRP